jgi:hypothetical protein
MPQQAHDYIRDRLEAATTVAKMEAGDADEVVAGSFGCAGGVGSATAD